MKLARLFVWAALLVPATMAAQQPANPATEAATRIGGRFARLLMAAADQIPEDMLSYKPTDAQLSFGHVWAHLAAANYNLCAGLGGMTAPAQAELAGTEPKETLVTALRASFAFCDQALAAMDDSKLGEEADLGFMRGTRALALFIYIDDLADHYSQVAIYMRLNDMLPPSAQPRN